MYDTQVFIDNLYLPEGGRWHNNALWFVDIWGKTIYRADSLGTLNDIITIEGTPAGIAWLADDTLLITSLFERLLLAYDGSSIKTYADLNHHAPPGYCHDLTVADGDIIYLSNSGFYPKFQAKVTTSPILKINDGIVSYAAKNLGYPNGIIINNNQLIVAETFASRLSVFDISTNGDLINHHVFATFDDFGFSVEFDKEGVPLDLTRVYPDGISCGKDGVIWVASPGTKEVLGVKKGGEITKRIKTRSMPFDCILGDDDTLYIMTTDMIEDKATGKIEVYPR
jgi:sugar lactone lactonase YvrE